VTEMDFRTFAEISTIRYLDASFHDRFGIENISANSDPESVTAAWSTSRACRI
jgi:hypothetical protein